MSSINRLFTNNQYYFQLYHRRPIHLQLLLLSGEIRFHNPLINNAIININTNTNNNIINNNNKYKKNDLINFNNNLLKINHTNNINSKYFSTSTFLKYDGLERNALLDNNNNNNTSCNRSNIDNWIRIINHAEKLVEYPTPFQSLRWLLSDESANVAVHLRKLVESTHPLLNTAKLAAQHVIFINDNNSHLLYNRKSNLLAWGLIVCLLSKAAGHSPFIADSEIDKSTSIMKSQKILSEISVMVRISNMVHQGLVNLQPLIQAGIDLSLHSDMVQCNKISLLSGDYLVSTASTELAALRNQELNELISSAVRDMAEAEFIGERDEQNNPLPSQPAQLQSSTTADNYDDEHLSNDALTPITKELCMGIPEKEWALRTLLNAGSLLGNSCQGVLKLARLPDNVQKSGYFFGKHVSLAWQACLDLEPFQCYDQLPAGRTFSLVSAPILFHLKYDPSLYDEIKKGYISSDDVDYPKIHSIIMKGPGIEKTKQLQRKHITDSLNILQTFPIGEARTALQNIILALQE